VEFECYLDGLFTGQRCFAADSSATLATGGQISIVDLQSGDVVLAYDDKTRKIISTHVITMLDKEPTQFGIFFYLCESAMFHRF
jgi:hypothetical protein